MTKPLHTTRDLADRFGVSVWTVTRAAGKHESYTVKLPGATGAYLFSDEDADKLGALLLGNEVAAANREAAESVRDVA